jgi:hypothetical protein
VNDRVSAWLDAGMRYRLWFSETDEHDGASLPFALCRRGDGIVVTNVLCGAIEGRQVRLFDLEVRVHDPETLVGLAAEVPAELERQAVTERWTCAMVHAGAECWRLSVAPENIVTALDDVVTLGDQNVELEAFNRAFEVRGDDRKFANDFLDQRMVEFLLAHAVGGVLETVGNRILVAQPASGPLEVDALLVLALGVADRVPTAVRTLYPEFPVGELTPGCPIGPDGQPRERPDMEELMEALEEDTTFVHDPGGWAPPLGSSG